jgi:GTP-binding protein HflX
MKRIFGNSSGLKPNQIRRLENLYRRRTPPEYLVTPELARDVSLLAHEIRRQIGLLIDRAGRVVYVVVGDTRRIVIPATDEYRAAPGRLNGLRCTHTHLNAEPLTQDDLTDLALLRLDLMAAIGLAEDGYPRVVHVAHLLPGSAERLPHRVLPPLSPGALDIDCAAMTRPSRPSSRGAPVRAQPVTPVNARCWSGSRPRRVAAQRSPWPSCGSSPTRVESRSSAR